jgi:subtilisin family serine protease
VYYAYLQGTSIASPHATGVAAVIITEIGSATVRSAGSSYGLERPKGS